MFRSIPERFAHLYDIDILSTSPWIVTLDKFLSDAEVEALITNVRKWERSTDTGSMNAFGETGRVLSEGRTSSNAWCTQECADVSEKR